MPDNIQCMITSRSSSFDKEKMTPSAKNEQEETFDADNDLGGIKGISHIVISEHEIEDSAGCQALLRQAPVGFNELLESLNR